MPKNAKKTEENIKAAQERLAKLQEQQRKCNELRKQGHLGSDLAIMRRLEEEKKEKERKEAQAKHEQEEQEARAKHEKDTHEARKFVDEALKGPHAQKIENFLGKNARGDAIKIAEITRNYLKTQGLIT